MSIVLYDKLMDCCGCSACVNICPKNAISLKRNEDGFIYPEINDQLCISCGQCLKVCNYQNKNKKKSFTKTFVAVAKNVDILESASGGVFSSIAKSFIQNGGIVYGATMTYDGKLYVRHIGIKNLSDLNKLKGSKYIQSDVQGIFKEIRNHLNNDNRVLFSGTPCQVDGLKGFLKKDYNNLYTIDLICHGVPSQQFFQDYIRYIEKKKHIKIIDFKFRDKHDGWKLYGKIKYMDLNNEIKEDFFKAEESSFYQLFLNSYIYRENCYQCPYACKNRPGDITIGDYWCIDLVHPEYLIENGGSIDEKKGVSTLIINNEKGNDLVTRYGTKIQKYESSYQQASKYNAQLIRPSVLNDKRNLVLKMYRKYGYEKVDTWYKRKLLVIKMKRKLIALIPQKIKKMIKLIIKK